MTAGRPQTVPEARGALGSVARMGTGWEDLELDADPARPGCFTTVISDPWMLAVVPQGGIVAAIAVYGAVRRGYEFTDIAPPVVEGPDGLRSYRDPVPAGVDFEFEGEPMAFWEQVIECRPAMGRPPWEPQEPGPAEMAYWYRLDDPPVAADDELDTAGLIVMCDTMPGAVSQRVADGEHWFGPSVDLTFHRFGSMPPGWVLAHNRARHAGDGYASVDMELWDPTTKQLLAYATQVMFFAFG